MPAILNGLRRVFRRPASTPAQRTHMKLVVHGTTASATPASFRCDHTTDCLLRNSIRPSASICMPLCTWHATIMLDNAACHIIGCVPGPSLTMLPFTRPMMYPLTLPVWNCSADNPSPASDSLKDLGPRTTTMLLPRNLPACLCPSAAHPVLFTASRLPPLSCFVPRSRIPDF